jgi:alcohol dehydrogenase class IV
VLPALAFELASPARIVFGAGAAARLGALAAELGRVALVVTGRSTARADSALAALAAAGVRATSFSIAGEPTVDAARSGAEAARMAGADLVVGYGGGSALDAAKAIAALAAKQLAIVDPDLLRGLPAAVIASSGLDALSQLIEPLVSARANPFSDALAREGIRRSVAALPAAHRAARAGDATTAADREGLAVASLFGGLCLANAGLGAVHGFAAPVGGMFDAPHGAVCAALLPPVLRANVAALRARDPDGPALARYHDLARLVTGRSGATIEEGVAFVTDLCAALDVPGLGRYGMTAADVPALVAKARAASSMKGNPIQLTDGELAEIATAAL